MDTGQCDLYSRLYMVCVQVKLNRETKKWELNAPVDDKPNNYGCASTNEWEPSLYNRITPARRSHHNGDSMEFKVRRRAKGIDLAGWVV